MHVNCQAAFGKHLCERIVSAPSAARPGINRRLNDGRSDDAGMIIADGGMLLYATRSQTHTRPTAVGSGAWIQRSVPELRQEVNAFRLQLI